MKNEGMNTEDVQSCDCDGEVGDELELCELLMLDWSYAVHSSQNYNRSQHHSFVDRMRSQSWMNRICTPRIYITESFGDAMADENGTGCMEALSWSTLYQNEYVWVVIVPVDLRRDGVE